MLASLTDVLRVAQSYRFAVGAFNTSNLEMTEAIIRAAEAMQAPVIVQTSEKALEYAGLETLAALIVARAKQSSVPVVLHLDHGRNLALIHDCIKTGYTSVMIDGSHLSYVDNVRATCAVVREAHVAGVSVEAELGTIGGQEDSISAKIGFTDPSQVASFVRETRCDALAVGIGNSHGKPKPGERLDLKRLEQIRQYVSIPLVLHGASGTPEDEIRQAINFGICKINIDTDLRLAFAAAERKILASDPTVYDPRAILGPAIDAVEAVVKEKIALFGGVGAASKVLA